ncbi:MAG: DNA mismatch repair endonuclease MutL [Thermoanaerobaculia bacterium]|nr:DNA mismatch repair endonuclease MutL [Thermoanaerobaculia bacterium]
MPRIRILDDQLVSQIAAGEVVERPASVVKELVENALDAGASRLEIELEGGGARRVRVADDGSGMDADDALLAFDRHATSKIARFPDLERVATLGFRGEALASIAAVSKVELDSAQAPGDGVRVRLEGTRVLGREPFARARGTTVDVRSLFWNVPARRKFLKTHATELRRCLEVVEGYALARPAVGFEVRHDGRVLLDAPALADDAAGLRARVAQLFGPELERRLEEIPAEAAASLAPGVHGLVGRPETAKRGRRAFVFVNRRLVRDRAVLAVFYRAVRDEWRSDNFPALFLFLDLPPEQVDVNVHPQKSEVRFRDGGYVERVGQLLRVALGRARGEEPAPLAAPRGPLAGPLGWEGLGGRHGAVEIAEGPGPAPAMVAGSSLFSGSFADSAAASRLAVTSLAPLDRAPIPLSGRSGEVRPFRLLGQYKGTLIVLEGPDGLYLLDQHVAHERILFERVRREMAAARPVSQRLLEPLLVELSRAERLRLAELAPALAEHGFELAELSGGTLALAAAPASLGPDEARALLAVLASDDEATPENLAQRLVDDLAAATACKAAVKMHHPLAAEKLEALVSELFRAENPYACPHGRPVVLALSDADLERRFGRR